MKPSIGKSIIGGIVATAVMTAMLYWVAPLMLPGPMDVAQGLSGIFGVTWALGMAIHWFNGVILFPLIYALILYRFLPGAPWVKGIWFGVILWIAAEITFVPMTGAGVFHGGMIMPIVLSLLGHVVYGVLLAAIAGEPAFERTTAEI